MNIFGLRISKDRFKFSSAHLTIFPDGSAEKLHGHNYRATVEVTGESLEEGLLYDSSKLKATLMEICNDLDEKTLFPTKSAHVEITDKGESSLIAVFGKEYQIPNADLKLLDFPNITMEMLAQYLCFELIRRLSLDEDSRGLHSLRVEIEETPGQCAWYRHHL